MSNRKSMKRELELKDKFKEELKEVKEEIKGKIEDTADNIADKTEEWKNGVQDFAQQCLDNMSVLSFGVVLGAVGVILLTKITRKSVG